MNNWIQSGAAALEQKLVMLRRQLHQNPELGMKEYETSKLIKSTLESYGIAAHYIRDNLGVTALIEGAHTGDTVALRADIDALPMQEQSGLPFSSRTANAAHSCGHDIHAAVLLGASIVLHQNRDRLQGNVRVIFQCAEETLHGARMAMEAGLLEHPKVKCIAALHCWPEIEAGTIGIKRGAMMSGSDSVDIRVEGKGGHAAHPHKSIDPIISLAYILTALQTLVSREIAPLDSVVLTIGKIEGGTARNIIPPFAQCQGSVRTLTPAVQDVMSQKIDRIVSHTAQALGCTASVEYLSQAPPLHNDDALVDRLENSLRESVGAQNIRYLSMPSMGSEDFACYLQHVPGLMMRLGTGSELPQTRLGLHNPGIVFDEAAIITGVTALSGFAASLLT